MKVPSDKTFQIYGALKNTDLSERQIAKRFGVTRQYVNWLMKKARLSGNPVQRPILQARGHKVSFCDLCRFILTKIQEEPVRWRKELIPPKISQSKWGYHMGLLKEEGLLPGEAVIFTSRRSALAFRAYRGGLSIREIHKRYGFKNYLSVLSKIQESHHVDVRPRWQREVEGEDIRRLKAYRVCGTGTNKNGRRVPFQKTIYAKDGGRTKAFAPMEIRRSLGIDVTYFRLKEGMKGNSI
jgi:transposase